MDRARKSAGYRAISEQKAHDSFEQANAAVQTRSTFTEFPVCAAAGCKSIPLTEQGAHAKVVVRRWWCSEHAHLAAPEDFQPPPGPRYGPSGELEFPGEREAEAARLRNQEERRKKSGRPCRPNAARTLRRSRGSRTRWLRSGVARGRKG